MFRRIAPLLTGIVLAAGICCAGTIDSLHIELGTWDGTSFSPDGSDWNTYNPGNWAIGATAAGLGNPLLDGYNSVSLPDGDYYLYMADNGDGALAIRITLDYSGVLVSEVFTSTTSAVYGTPGPYTLVSGSGFTAGLVTPPQSANVLVSQGQNYTPGGSNNWIVDLNSSISSVPEPGTWMLLIGGLASLPFLRRTRRT